MLAHIAHFPGINRLADMQIALEAAGFATAVLDHRQSSLPPNIRLLVIPGGFSYGDYLRPGAIAATTPLARAILPAAGQGLPILGVCNGFQILCELGLLPGVLRRNPSRRFACRMTRVRVVSRRSLLTRDCEPGAVLSLPIANIQGWYHVPDGMADELAASGQIVMRYVVDAHDPVDLAVSDGQIAAVSDASGRIVGMMPHPENAIAPHGGSVDGLSLLGGVLDQVSAVACPSVRGAATSVAVAAG